MKIKKKMWIRNSKMKKNSKKMWIEIEKIFEIAQKKIQNHNWLIMMMITSSTFKFVLTNFFFDVTDFLNARMKAKTKTIFIDSIFVSTSKSASNSVEFYADSDRWILWFRTESFIVHSRKNWIILIWKTVQFKS